MTVLQSAARAQPAATFDEFVYEKGAKDICVDDNALRVEVSGSRGP
ncbi:hypothetical protein [Streptomyces xanthophaeus]|nr:hypothetical protein [Streptomyces xanthophaeus]